MEPLINLEEGAYRDGYRVIAGVDEAGRGPLAGPVVAAACVFPRGFICEGVDDSKKLSPKKREEIYGELAACSEIYFAVGTVDHLQIDEVNILRASLEAMAIAVKNLEVDPDYLLIDGKYTPQTGVVSRAIIKGDCLSQSIGAASIIAKYTRDQIMLQSHLKWPEYGFDRHKGYATRMHIEALNRYGPCPIHRRSFEPIKSLVAESFFG